MWERFGIYLTPDLHRKICKEIQSDVPSGWLIPLNRESLSRTTFALNTSKLLFGEKCIPGANHFIVVVYSKTSKGLVTVRPIRHEELEAIYMEE